MTSINQSILVATPILSGLMGYGVGLLTKVDPVLLATTMAVYGFALTIIHCIAKQASLDGEFAQKYHIIKAVGMFVASVAAICACHHFQLMAEIPLKIGSIFWGSVVGYHCAMASIQPQQPFYSRHVYN